MTLMVLDPCVDGSFMTQAFETLYAPANFALEAQVGSTLELILEGVGI
jgi:hypothetical protein